VIALASGEIVLNSHAVLGPDDPQLGEYRAASLMKAVHAKDVNRVSGRSRARPVPALTAAPSWRSDRRAPRDPPHHLMTADIHDHENCPLSF
jgi:hypothetical protein